jgi:hypothetical protein
VNRRAPTRIGELIGTMLPPNRGSDRLVPLLRLWPAAVGEAIARESAPARLDEHGTLTVHVTSSVWATELTLLADQVLAQLTAALGAAAPTAVRFRVGPVAELASPPPAKPRLAIDPETHARAERLASMIPDRSVRAAVEAAYASAHTRNQQRNEP